MKLQIAIDRLTIEQAIEIVEAVGEYADIIEIGTSFFKDYGLSALQAIRQVYDGIILADIKTIDEAAYEFHQIYKHGADIATVMGASSLASIEICQQVAQEYNKKYMIDLLEVADEKIQTLMKFDDAILGLHLSIDQGGDIEKYVSAFKEKFNPLQQLAIAGGVTLTNIAMLKSSGIDIAIVGSNIIKSTNIAEAAKTFKEAIQ